MKIASIIKYEGDKDTIVWKHPEEDFNSFSELIVHESQEAVFMKNGQVCDVFGPGRHKLSTQNLPILRRLVAIPFDGQTPFHCEVYFINKAYMMDIFWGTRHPMQYEDIKYNTIFSIGASGQMAVQIENANMFLNLIVGTTSQFDKNNLITAFRGIVVSCLKDNLAKIMQKKQISVFNIDSSLEDLSKNIMVVLGEKLRGYGVRLINFAITNVHVPKDDPSYIRIKEALAKRGEMNIIGYGYHEERTFDMLDKAVQNQGAPQSTMMGAGMGLGMGLNVGNAVGNSMGGIFARFNQQPVQPQYQADPYAQQMYQQQYAQPVQQTPAYTQPQQPETQTPPVQPQTPPAPPVPPRPPQRPVAPAPAKPQTPQMQTCPKCGKNVPVGKFCLSCGEKLENVCSSCGKQLPEGANFCLNCGTKVGG